MREKQLGIGKLEEGPTDEVVVPLKMLVASSESSDEWTKPKVVEVGVDYSLADSSKSEEKQVQLEREMTCPPAHYDGTDIPDSAFELETFAENEKEPLLAFLPKILEPPKRAPAESVSPPQPASSTPLPPPSAAAPEPVPAPVQATESLPESVPVISEVKSVAEPVVQKSEPVTQEPPVEQHEPSATTREQSVELDVIQSIMQQNVSTTQPEVKSDESSTPPEMMKSPAEPFREKDKRKFESMPKPVNYKTVPCRLYHSPIGCARGEFCHFIHDQEYQGKELPPELWKNKRKRHESSGPSYYPPYSSKMMPFPMIPSPYMYGPPPMGQPPMRMPFPIPPRGYMPFPQPQAHSPEHSSSHRSGSSRSHGSKK